MYKVYTLTNNNYGNVSDFIESFRDDIINLIEEMKKENNSIKGQISLECTYERILINKENQFTTMIYNNKSIPIYLLIL